MGGGAGLSMNSMFRVVTENTVLIYPLFIILLITLILVLSCKNMLIF